VACEPTGEGESTLTTTTGEGEGEGESVSSSGEGEDALLAKYLCGASCLTPAFECLLNDTCLFAMAEMVGCTFVECAIDISFNYNGKISGNATTGSGVNGTCFDNNTSCYDFTAGIKIADLADAGNVAKCFA